MRKILFLLSILQMVIWVAQAQNDYMYFMKDGAIVTKYNVNTELDSIIFYKPSNPGDSEQTLQSSITKDGITWTFSKPVPVGRFVNGDYYVVGPVRVINIDPLPTPENGKHGSVLNMPCNNASVSPFDSRVSGNRYRENMRIYPPFDMEPGDKLISSISSKNEYTTKAWLRPGDRYDSPVSSVSVLTVLAEPVAADAFRPGYCDNEQVIYYSNNLRRSLLPNLEKVRNVPDIEEFAEHYRRPWLDVCFFSFDAATDYQACYGRENGRASGMASLLLMLDFSSVEKEKLLINFVQYGIDLWSIVKSGYGGWPAHGGHGSGRKWPIIFAGLMLGDADMQKPNTTYPNLKFGEDMQTMHDNCWTGANAVYAGHQGVWNGQAVSGRASWGPYEHLHPSQWPAALGGEYLGESYRRCCTSLAWVGQALAAILMDAQDEWDHPAFFDYVHRWMTENDREHVQIIRQETGQDFTADWAAQGQCWDQFVEQMWARYYPAP